jgi:hypothetical protein
MLFVEALPTRHTQTSVRVHLLSGSPSLVFLLGRILKVLFWQADETAITRMYTPQLQSKDEAG